MSPPKLLTCEIGDIIADYAGDIGTVTDIDPDGYYRVEWEQNEIEFYDLLRLQKFIKYFNQYYGNR